MILPVVMVMSDSVHDSDFYAPSDDPQRLNSIKLIFDHIFMKYSLYQKQCGRLRVK